MAGEATPLTRGEAALLDAAGMPENLDALDRHMTAAAAELADLIATALSVAAAAARVGISSHQLRRMIHARAVWALRGNDRWLLPIAQLDGHAFLPGWTHVAQALAPHLHPLQVHGFLMTPQPELTRASDTLTVVRWLRDGGSPEVPARLARELD